MLASEYGWTKSYILENLYFEDVFSFAPVIERRRIGNLRIQLAITENPHRKDPSQLWNVLDTPEERLEAMELDKTGFAALKTRLHGSGGFTVK